MKRLFTLLITVLITVAVLTFIEGVSRYHKYGIEVAIQSIQAIVVAAVTLIALLVLYLIAKKGGL